MISIIIPVRNGEKTIEKCISSIFNLDYSDYELIVVNDGSTDRTEEIINNVITQFIEKKNKFKLIKTEGVGPSEARNIAIREAKGEFIAFTDADCIVDKNWLNELLKGFSSNDVVGVGGSQLTPEDDTDFSKKIHEFMNRIGFVTEYIKSTKDKALKEVSHNPTCNVMYRKKIFSEIGGFLKGLWPNEDVEFDLRVKKKGYKLIYNPSAVVYHYRPDSLKKFLSMMFRYGKSQGYTTTLYGFFRKIQIVPVVFLLLLILEIFLLVKNFIYGIIFPILLVFFALIYLRSLEFASFLFLTVIVWSFGFFCGIIKYK
ncbi:MAG: glycosyltransferase [Endomicrobiia bacterium]